MLMNIPTQIYGPPPPFVQAIPLTRLSGLLSQTCVSFRRACASARASSLCEYYMHPSLKADSRVFLLCEYYMHPSLKG